MDLNVLQTIFEKEQVRELCWEGQCHDCNTETEVLAHVEDDGKIDISGGAIYHVADSGTFLKCPFCFKKDSVLRNYQTMEIYSRVVGYLRPVSQFNPGKQQEFEERTNFIL